MAKTARKGVKLSDDRRAKFLEALATSCHVSESANAAGRDKAQYYKLRREDAAFRQAWADAIVEGYTHLEAAMLADALRPATGHMTALALREHAQKQRIRAILLKAHWQAARGGTNAAVSTRAVETPAELRERLLGTFVQMRRRIDAGAPDGL